MPRSSRRRCLAATSLILSIALWSATPRADEHPAGPAHPLEVADAVLFGVEFGARVGEALAAPGDFDGDGLDDVVVGAPVAADGAGRLYIVSVDELQLADVELDHAAQFLAAPPGVVGFGSSLVTIGDVNADGWPDLLADCRPAVPDGGSARLLLVLGGPEPRTVELDLPPGWGVDGAAPLGDQDQDGAGEVALSVAREGDAAAVVVIGLDPDQEVADVLSLAALERWRITLAGPAPASLVTAADTGDDGLPELWVGLSSDASESGVAVALVRFGPDAAPVRTLESATLTPIASHLAAGGHPRGLAEIAMEDGDRGLIVASAEDGGGRAELFRVFTSQPGQVEVVSTSPWLAADPSTLRWLDLGPEGVALMDPSYAGSGRLSSMDPADWSTGSIDIVGAPGDELARSFAVLDLDGDGDPDVCLGAPGEGEGAGSVYCLLAATRRAEQLLDDDSHAEGSYSDGDSQPARAVDRPFGMAPMNGQIDEWIRERLGNLGHATPGQVAGLTLRWSALSESTLDGESVAGLLPGAAGLETVVDGRYRHRIPLVVPGGGTVDPPDIGVSFVRGSESPELGLHWALALDAVQRRGPTGGFPTGTADDRFYLQGRELVRPAIAAAQVGQVPYEFRDGGNEVVRYHVNEDLWTVRDGGVLSEFGTITGLCGSTQVGPTVAVTGAPPTTSQSWALCRTRDDRDNATLYVYGLDQRILHVAWGEPGAVGTSPDPDLAWALRVHRLDFVYDQPGEIRWDVTPSGLAPRGERLGSVTHRVSPTGTGHNVERSWTFTYLQNGGAERKVLSEIWLHGSPDESGIVQAETRLRQFRYRADSSGLFDVGPEWSDSTDISAQLGDLDGWRVRTFSANHDALTDLVLLKPDEAWNGKPLCALECPPTPADSCFPTVTQTCFEPGDLEFAAICGHPLDVRVFVNIGELQFVEDQEAAAVIQSVLDPQDPFQGEETFVDIDGFLAAVQFIDLNGDGMDDVVGPDAVLMSPADTDWRPLGSWLTTAIGHPPVQLVDWQGDSYVWADVDGDGRPDRIQTPTQDRVEQVQADGQMPGGACIAPPVGNYAVELNRSVGDAAVFEALDSNAVQVPFFSPGPHRDELILPNLAAPIGPPSGINGLLACEQPNGTPGYLVTDQILATMDFDEASMSAASTGKGYLAQSIRFEDANADGCADVLIAMETQPLKEISARCSCRSTARPASTCWTGRCAGRA